MPHTSQTEVILRNERNTAENACRPALTSPVAADVAVDWIFQLLVLSARICLRLMLIGVMGIAPFIL